MTIPPESMRSQGVTSQTWKHYDFDRLCVEMEKQRARLLRRLLDLV